MKFLGSKFFTLVHQSRKMEAVSDLIKKDLPNYLSNLPIPNSFGGWFRLGHREWAQLVPLGTVIGGITFLVYKAYCPKAHKSLNQINKSVKKGTPKVVDCFDIEDLADKAAFCRCWRTKKWPYCDGSHSRFNEQTGDNVGPLCLQHKSKQ